MDKSKALEIMRLAGACNGPETAMKFVRDHPSDDAGEIWLDCTSVDWLCWAAFRVLPELAAGFAHRCADSASAHSEVCQESAKEHASAVECACAAALYDPSSSHASCYAYRRHFAYKAAEAAGHAVKAEVSAALFLHKPVLWSDHHAQLSELYGLWPQIERKIGG